MSADESGTPTTDQDPTPPSSDPVLAALQSSHDRLLSVVAPLTPEQLTGPSYASEWTIADALSHLGSGAEIFTLFVPLGLSGEAPPAFGEFQAIWDVWNARTPEDQAREALVSDGAFLDAVHALTPSERAGWQMSLFGSDQDLAGVLRMRLGEHTLHTWDVAVAIDPAATLPADAVELLLPGLTPLVARTGRASETSMRVSIQTTDPQVSFVVDADADGVRLGAGDSRSADLTLPAEAFIRLVYGRLDVAHTPAGVAAGGVDLDQLRRIFPGF